MSITLGGIANKMVGTSCIREGSLAALPCQPVLNPSPFLAMFLIAMNRYNSYKREYNCESFDLFIMVSVVMIVWLTVVHHLADS
jgi:hypothetical protein